MWPQEAEGDRAVAHLAASDTMGGEGGRGGGNKLLCFFFLRGGFRVSTLTLAPGRQGGLGFKV